MRRGIAMLLGAASVSCTFVTIGAGSGSGSDDGDASSTGAATSGAEGDVDGVPPDDATGGVDASSDGPDDGSTTAATMGVGESDDDEDSGGSAESESTGSACPQGCLPELSCVDGVCVGEVALPLEDTYVSGEYYYDNFGSAGVLLVDDFPLRRTLIQPTDLGGIPADATVVSATLHLTCFDPGATTRVRRLTEAWSAATVTMDTMPADDGVVLFVYDANVGPIEIDLTTLAQSWVDGTAPVHGVVIRTNDIDGSDYYSTEHDVAAERPALVLDVSY